MPTTDAIFTIRFVGPELKVHGMPIYELGAAFIAIQRLFHKAHLSETEKLTKGKYPEKAVRKRLALQIGAHERRSDFFGLVPIVTDPSAREAISSAAEFVYDVIKSYAAKKVLDVLKTEKDESKQVYIGSVQADVVNIVNRIGNTGGCESIEIGAPHYAPQQVLELDSGIRDYVRMLGHEYFLGKSQELVGDVFKLYPNLGMVEVRRKSGKRKCKVFFLEEKDFERVRLSKNPSPRISVYGRPRYRLGAEGRAFTEFEGQALREVEDEG